MASCRLHGTSVGATQNEHLVGQSLAICQPRLKLLSTGDLHAEPRPPAHSRMRHQCHRQVAHPQCPRIHVSFPARRINQFHGGVGEDVFVGAHIIIIKTIDLCDQRRRKASVASKLHHGARRLGQDESSGSTDAVPGDVVQHQHQRSWRTAQIAPQTGY